MNWLSLSGVGALGMVFAIRKGEGRRASKILKHGLWVGGLGVLALCVLLSVGCGGGSSGSSHQQASTVTGDGDRHIWIDQSFNSGHAYHPVIAESE